MTINPVWVFCLFLLTFLVQSRMASSQCTAPSGATVTPTAAACAGQGRIVAKVTNPPVGAVYQYQLQYDSVANTSVVKPWQSSDTFTTVGAAQYKVYIRRVCSSSFSTEYVSASVVVTSGTTPLSISQANPLSKSSCGNGSLKVTAAGGNVAVPYQYALVPTLSEPEPVSNYVRPQQNSNTFTGLPAGTYYARAYDGCGSYASATIVIDSIAENVTVSSQNPSNYTFYACDSIRVLYTVRLNNRLPDPSSSATTIPVDPSERFWITYNGTTDTLGIFGPFIYTASLGTAQISPSKILHAAYPMTVTYGYKSTCGNVYTHTVTIVKPNLKLQLSSSSVSCSQKNYTIRTTDSLSGAVLNYVNTRMSLDSGATWSALNTSNSYSNNLFTVGTTYSIWVASACDTEKIVVTAVLPTLSMIISPFTAYSCNGNSGFYIQALNYSGNVDSIKFNVLSQPAGGTLPDSFYMRQTTNANGGTVGFNLSYNIVPGAYSIKVTDRCGITTTQNLTINPTTVAFTTSPLLSCLPSQSGFRVNVTETNYQPGAGYSAIRVIVTNTATNQVDSFTNTANVTSRPVNVDVTGLPNGTYTIKVIKVRPTTLPYPTCPVTGTYTNTSNQPLSLTQSTFTSACANGTATVSATVQGGGGSNQFYLDQQGSGGSWTQVFGPQTSPVFNNLLANNTYRVRVTDACGNGTQYSTSFSNSGPMLEFVTTTAPCPGDAFTMMVDSSAGATYSWQKNSVTIGGATGSSYTVNPVPAAGSDTFKVKTTYGNCDVFSNTYIINPVFCGMPLPVRLRSFNGILNAQNKAALKWEVANYETVKSFDIEYSTDGTTFVKAGTLVSNNSPYYQFTDEQRTGKVLYYRLRMAGIDGEAAYSAVLRLNNKAGVAAAAKAYPTIVTDKLHISYTASEDGQLSWSVSNIAGSKVRQGIFNTNKGSSILTVDGLTALPAGTYILTLSDGAIFRHNEKIVIRK